MAASNYRIGAALFLVIGLSTVGVVALDDADDGDEQEISLKEAPAAIQEALRGIDVEEIEVEMKNGQKIYEVAIESDGTEIELQLTADAKLVGMEIEDDDQGKDDDGADDDN